MKGKNLDEMPPSTRISTCEKGIYKAFLMEAKRGRNYQMPVFDNNTLQNMSYSDRGGRK
jgi:hypothetical protein